MTALPASSDTVHRGPVHRDRDDGGPEGGAIETKLAAIRFMHLKTGHVSPRVSQAVIEERKASAGMIGTAPTKKKAATGDIIAGMAGLRPGRHAQGQASSRAPPVGFAEALPAPSWSGDRRGRDPYSPSGGRKRTRRAGQGRSSPPPRTTPSYARWRP